MCIEQTRNGTAPNRPDLQGRSSDMQRNRCAQQRQGCALRWRRTATRGDGGAKKGVGIAGICPALRGLSGQRTCEGAEKRGAKKQVHREARALKRKATEMHCRAYAKALKGDALHRHRGAVTRRAREMSSIDKCGVSLAEKRFGVAWLGNRLEKLSRGTAETSR